ncbi:hypothetical protein [Nocardioides aurantiacus]|uniref:Uncharacterized protein n=1 Tax=Nocardioides aurantiacus TaxID=86796 RepID=A0A3N2CTT5_9ACTN|nr:hypothetical protein [Nocardioides aurantiacus]ROR90931.1 hypothetical protein EDD33_1787 [Nocardioides aurantiacus]
MKIGITGHQQAPAEAWTFVEAKLQAQLAAAPQPLIGVTSLAAGADQLFARHVLAAGGTIEAVIPCDDYEATFDDGGTQYRLLLAQTTRTTKLKFAEPSEEAFLAAGKQVVDDVDIVFAVWDGEDAKGLGGTADVVRYAQSQETPVLIIWPDGTRR